MLCNTTLNSENVASEPISCAHQFVVLGRGAAARRRGLASGQISQMVYAALSTEGPRSKVNGSKSIVNGRCGRSIKESKCSSLTMLGANTTKRNEIKLCLILMPLTMHAAGADLLPINSHSIELLSLSFLEALQVL